MAKAKKLIFILMLAISISIISASHDISPSSFSVTQSQSEIYNITITNTDTGANANITSVAIALPTEIVFDSNTAGTDSSGSFSGTTTLTWTHATSLIDSANYSNNVRSFWFNATSATTGSFTMTITTTNSTGTFNKTVSVDVQSAPLSITFESPTPAENQKIIISEIVVNVSTTGNINTIQINLYDTNNTLLDTYTSTTSPASKTFTGLSDGVYYFNASVNDSTGITKKTETRGIVVQTSSCTPDVTCTDLTECTNGEKTQTCTDANACDPANVTYNQTIECSVSCKADDWVCTEWAPETCPKNGTQTRTCTLNTNCMGGAGKPTENKTCTPEGINWIFILIVTGIIVLIAIIGGIVLYLFKKPSVNSQPQQPQGFMGGQPGNPNMRNNYPRYPQ